LDIDPREYAGARDPAAIDAYDPRWYDDQRDQESHRHHFGPERDPADQDPREPIVRSLDLPRRLNRELVQDSRDNVSELNGVESRMLATIGAFRVAAARDLETLHEPNSGTCQNAFEHLHDEGLVRFVTLDGDERAVVLTREGRDLLETNRRERGDDEQAFHCGVSHPRELEHDSQLFAAYLEVEERLREQGAEIERVVLEVDLRREYQEWLQEHNKGNPASDGRPDRDAHKIEEWARDHDLPYVDGGVQFPDFRIEYEVDGRTLHEDVEVMSEHYRGAYAASKARAGFTCYRRGGRSGRDGGSPFDPDAARRFL
jgi:DNA-binding PadR family transcriptional regulator